MAKILVEESALDSIKRMAEELQAERDKLYWAISNISTAENSKEQADAIDDAILLLLECK